MKKQILILASCAVAATLAGCISSPAGIAPSTVPITSEDSYTIVRRDVEGTDTGVFFFGLPLSRAASGYEAIKDAKDQAGADALINVTAENRYNYFMIFIGLWWEEVAIKGDAVRFKVGDTGTR